MACLVRSAVQPAQFDLNRPARVALLTVYAVYTRPEEPELLRKLLDACGNNANVLAVLDQPALKPFVGVIAPARVPDFTSIHGGDSILKHFTEMLYAVAALDYVPQAIRPHASHVYAMAACFLIIFGYVSKSEFETVSKLLDDSIGEIAGLDCWDIIAKYTNSKLASAMYNACQCGQPVDPRVIASIFPGKIHPDELSELTMEFIINNRKWLTDEKIRINNEKFATKITIGKAIELGHQLDAPISRWNELCSELTALEATAASFDSENAEFEKVAIRYEADTAAAVARCISTVATMSFARGCSADATQPQPAAPPAAPAEPAAPAPPAAAAPPAAPVPPAAESTATPAAEPAAPAPPAAAPAPPPAAAPPAAPAPPAALAPVPPTPAACSAFNIAVLMAARSAIIDTIARLEACLEASDDGCFETNVGSDIAAELTKLYKLLSSITE